jgi:hypothetical protein
LEEEEGDDEEEDVEVLKLRLYHERQQKIAMVKVQIATVAHEVLENPESKVISLLPLALYNSSSPSSAKKNGRAAESL